ncbi:MAG TPA: prepilin-type N-terminal cleavage/methylation domain-containing protein [Anoxybacillus sp.]|nr:prepilin-type N-terminal cleavage/methylation domain-containing protein [Anoxybacillus sp.]
MKKILKSQRGLTLIELLAVLALLAIVGTVVTSGLINSMKAYQSSTEHINLRQEANLLIETISNLHKRNEDCVIDYNPTNKTLSINGQPFNTKGYQILFSYNSSDYNKSIQSKNLSIENPVMIKFKLIDQQEREFEVQTKLQRLE